MSDVLLTDRIEDRLTRIATLEALVVSLEATIICLRAENTALLETVAQKDAIIRKCQSVIFGKKSEKQVLTDSAPSTEGVPPAPEQESVPPSPPVEPTPPVDSQTPAAPKRPRGQRRGAPGHGRRLYEELETREEFHALPDAECQCPHCGLAYRTAGTEDATEIEWEVTIRRVLHHRIKYVSVCTCQAPVLVTAPAPPKVIAKGLLTESTLANLVVNKFLHGQPINRQLAEIALWCGMRLSPGTLVGALTKVGQLLRPLYTGILLHLRDADHWHADETRWLQFGDETKHRWWLWLFASEDSVVFLLDPTRSRAVPQGVLGREEEDDTGDPQALQRLCRILNCDRWKSYQGIPGIKTAFCWAHVRRDFIDLAKGYPALLGHWARDWVQRISTLYHLWYQRRQCAPGTDDFRHADARLREHVDGMARVRDQELAGTHLLQDARKALDSLIRHWGGLTLFLDHLGVPLDNNEAERLLRTLVVGRKNFFGSGSFASGALTESACTILLTAVRNGLNPLTFLRAYLHACAVNGGKTPTNIERFYPWTASPQDLAAWKLPPSSAN